MNLIEFAFFPGVLFHEFSHMLACLFVGAKVTRIGFRSVTHHRTGPWRGFFISFAPFLFGSLTAILLLWVAQTGLKHWFALDSLGLATMLIFYWLGFSIAVFCFPSEKDARNAMGILFEFYLDSLLLKEGWLKWLFCVVTLIPIFAPMAFLASLMLFFSRVKGLGLLWAILLFLATGFWVGVW
ncbi:MAG: hypothetical protein J7L23_02835 [Candidatus Diapherotrites archaeon]|nr:hypothetical protein [Candidatus Diapherotrites archaeon]